MASCDQCTQGYVLPGEPTGSIVSDFGCTAYLHAAPEGGAHPTSAVVLLTDIFGLPLKNCKIMADELSKAIGCDVWVPDLFDGRPPFAVDELEPLMPQRPSDKMSIWTKLYFACLAFTRIFKFLNVRASVVDARVISFVEKIKAAKKYEKIGAVGYCFGGGIAIRLGSQPSLLSSVVICHPGGTTLEAVKKIKVPSSWACAEEDMSFKTPMRDEAEAFFAARKDTPEFTEYEFKDYKGTVHGFAARPNFGIPESAEGYKGALEQTTEWFKKTL